MLISYKKTLFVLSLLCASLQGWTTEVEETFSDEIILVPVAPSPEPENAEVKILSPIEGDIKTINPVKIQLDVQGFSLGTQSTLSRETEIAHEPGIETLHVIVDNHPYFEIYQQVVDASIGEQSPNLNQKIDFDIPFTLEPGMHILRIFPAQSFQEGMKAKTVFATRSFYFKMRKNNPEFDLTRPYLTYNQPQGKYEYKIDEPILLDFYVSNCTLSPTDYKIRLTIDNSFTLVLTEWTPYYINGLKKGAHKMELELLDPQNKPVPGMLNHVQKVITLY